MAGAGYKLFNTGDVLTAAQVNTYLQEQVVMVFNDATARTTALSGVLAEGMVSYLKSTKVVEIYNGTAWASLDDPNAIQNTIVDAKGDLIAATGNDVPARLAVGNNGETLVADSSTSTGLRWQGNFAAGKNKIINGDMNIWQRGTSFTNPGTGYTADRFWVTRNGSGATGNITRESFTAGSAPVAGYESPFFYRYNQTVAGTGGTFSVVATFIEDVRTLAGQTVTFSFWAKAGATITLPSITFNQNFGSGGSADVDTTLASNVSISTSWTRYSYTVTMPSVSGKTIGSSSYVRPTIYLPLNSTFTFDTWGWQLEAGNTATAFQTATGTLAGELAACQRYYYRVTPGTDYIFGTGLSYNTTSSLISIPYPVPMRIRPTALEQTGTASNYKTLRANAAAFDNCTAVPTFDNGTSGNVAVVAVTSANLVSGNVALLFSNSSTAYLGWSAEL